MNLYQGKNETVYIKFYFRLMPGGIFGKAQGCTVVHSLYNTIKAPHKQPPKKSRLSGYLRELVVYVRPGHKGV